MCKGVREIDGECKEQRESDNEKVGGREGGRGRKWEGEKSRTTISEIDNDNIQLLGIL